MTSVSQTETGWAATLKKLEEPVLAAWLILIGAVGVSVFTTVGEIGIKLVGGGMCALLLGWGFTVLIFKAELQDRAPLATLVGFLSMGVSLIAIISGLSFLLIAHVHVTFS